MDPQKLDRLANLRGDPKKGLGTEAWAEALDGVPRGALHHAVLEVVSSLLIQDWADQRKADRRPQEALEATTAWLAAPSDEALKRVKAAAKACTAAKNETFGVAHRVPEAARAVAWAAGADEATRLYEALALTEHELLDRVGLTGEYHRGPEQRRAILTVLKNKLAPAEPKEPVASPVSSARDTGPVPYNADGHFELGQRVTHKKFGEMSVVSVGETWIEVELGDGTKKRLAHSPKG